MAQVVWDMQPIKILHLHHFNSLNKDLDPTALYPISMNGPNVNMKFF